MLHRKLAAVAVVLFSSFAFAQGTTTITCESQSTENATALSYWTKSLEHVTDYHQFGWYWANTCDYHTVKAINGFPCAVDETAQAFFPSTTEFGLINTAPARYHYVTTKTQVVQAHSPDAGTIITNAGAGGGVISCLQASGCGPFQVTVPPFTITNAAVVEDSGTLLFSDSCSKRLYVISPQHCKCGGACRCGCPLVMNTQATQPGETIGAGINISQFTSVDDGIRFKLKRTGPTWAATEPQRIAWTKPGSKMAVLVLPDEDGKIETSEQLFGNETSCGEKRCANGFAALRYKCDRREAGGNEDGACDSRDRLWPRLRLLIGKPRGGKLYTMREMGVRAINVSAYHQLTGRFAISDEYGNEFNWQGYADMGAIIQDHGFMTNYREVYDVNLRDESTK